MLMTLSVVLVYVVVDSNFARVVCVCILTECFVLPIRRENASDDEMIICV